MSADKKIHPDKTSLLALIMPRVKASSLIAEKHAYQYFIPLDNPPRDDLKRSDPMRQDRPNPPRI